MKWFKHDTDSSIDAKLQELLLDYGATGYGLYWYCVELISKDVKPSNITFELEHDARVISRNLNLSLKETKDMMQKMVDLGLFDISANNKISCITLAYRLDDSMRKGRQVDEIVNKFKESGKSRIIPDKSGKSHLDIDIDIDIDIDKDIDIELDKDKNKIKGKSSYKKTEMIDSLFDGISEQVKKDFIAHRKNKKALITETAMNGIKREADKAGVSLETALKECCERGWVGFKADWYKNQSNQTKGNGRDLEEEARRFKALKSKLYPDHEKDITP